MQKIMCCFLSMFVTIAAAQAQGSFVIKGELTNLKEDAKVILGYFNSGEKPDTVDVKNGVFVIKGTIKEPGKAFVKLLTPLHNDGQTAGTDGQEFFIEKGITQLKGTDRLETAVIKGGQAQADYLLLQDSLKPYNDRMRPLTAQMMKLFKDKDEAAQKALFPQLRAIRLQMNKVEEDFIRSHPDSWVSLDLVESHSVNLKPEIIEPLLMGLSRKLRNSAIGKYLATRLASEKKTGIGQPAIPFTQNDTEGKPVSLASFKGKYVLVDFWASWCSPCRAENPNLLKAYNQFKDKNFEIIGVSLDHNKAFWLKAVKEDGMPWIQLSDLQGPNNAAARAYGITGIPQNFLLDPNGVIIAKDLRGEEVIKKLTEVLSK